MKALFRLRISQARNEREGVAGWRADGGLSQRGSEGPWWAVRDAHLDCVPSERFAGTQKAARRGDRLNFRVTAQPARAAASLQQFCQDDKIPSLKQPVRFTSCLPEREHDAPPLCCAGPVCLCLCRQAFPSSRYGHSGEAKPQPPDGFTGLASG